MLCSPIADTWCCLGQVTALAVVNFDQSDRECCRVKMSVCVMHGLYFG